MAFMLILPGEFPAFPRDYRGAFYGFSLAMTIDMVKFKFAAASTETDWRCGRRTRDVSRRTLGCFCADSKFHISAASPVAVVNNLTHEIARF